MMGRLSSLSLLIAVLATACGAPAASPSRDASSSLVTERSTRLRAALGEDVVTMSSRFTNTRNRLDPVVNAFLTQTDDHWALFPGLAERIPSQDDGSWTLNPDGTMRMVWTLRPNLKWQDGQPLLAHDVVFAYDVYRDPEMPTVSRIPEQYMGSVIARDDRTFEINWSRPFFPAGESMGSGSRDLTPLPSHILEDAYRSGDKQAFINSSFWSTEDYVGAGPYRVVHNEPGVQLKLEANPNYYLGRPKIDAIDFFIVKDKNAAVARLLAGDLDFVEHMYIQAEHAAVLQEQWRVTREGRILVTLWEPFILGFQQKDVVNHQPALRDVRVREAVVRSIDRDALALSEAAGLGAAADTLVVPTSALFPRIDPVIIKYPYDPRRASQLLQDAGWQRPNDGALRNSAGQPFSIGIISTINTQKGSVIVGDYFKQAGMEPSLYALSPTERTEGQRLRATYPGVDVSSPLDYRSYSSVEMASEQNGWRGNTSGWSDPTYDDLFNRFDRSLVQSERDDLQVQLELYVASALGNAKLYYAARPAAMRNSLQGPRGMNYGSTFTWNIHEWTLN